MIPGWFREIRQFPSVVDAIIRIPLTMIFEEGEVYGTFEELENPSLQKSMSRKRCEILKNAAFLCKSGR